MTSSMISMVFVGVLHFRFLGSEGNEIPSRQNPTWSLMQGFSIGHRPDQPGYKIGVRKPPSVPRNQTGEMKCVQKSGKQ